MARQMKDSGIEWIGEIPEAWEITNIGRLFSVKAGGDAKPEFYSDTQDSEHKYPVYTNTLNPNQVYAYTSQPLFPGNSITVTGRGDIGHAFYRTTDYDAIIRLLVLTPECDIDCRYYAYWIENVITFFTNSAAVGQLSAQQIVPYKTCYLPLAEQQRIASFLDRKCAEIDAVIERTKATIEEYKKLKQAVITEAVTKGVRGPRPMKDSGIEWIGEIPEEWRTTALKRICRRISDGSHFSPETTSTGKPYVTAGDIHGKGIDYTRCRTISDEDFDLMVKAGCQPHKGDVLIVKDGATTGRVGLMTDDEDCVLLSSVAMITPAHGVNSTYLMYLMESKLLQHQISKSMAGSAMPRITLINLVAYTVIDCPEEEQIEIVTYLDEKCAALDTLIAKKTALLTELETYKKSLIYECVTGKKEVSL